MVQYSYVLSYRIVLPNLFKIYIKLLIFCAKSSHSCRLNELHIINHANIPFTPN